MKKNRHSYVRYAFSAALPDSKLNQFKFLYEEEVNSLNRKLEYTENILKASPPQDLRVRMKGKYRSYYYVVNGQEHYLPKGSPLLPALILKYCASHLRRELQKQHHILLRHPDLYEPDIIETTLVGFEERFKELTPAAFSSNKTYLAKWDAQPYRKNPYFDPLQKLYKSKKGDLVRSKLEMIVADILFDLGLHYRYDAGVVLKNGKYRYPDFTIINPYTRKIYYLEICGMMDDIEYVSDQVRKLQEYSEIDIVIGENLLLVFENEHTSFDPEAFQKMLDATVLKKRF